MSFVDVWSSPPPDAVACNECCTIRRKLDKRGGIVRIARVLMQTYSLVSRMETRGPCTGTSLEKETAMPEWHKQ